MQIPTRKRPWQAICGHLCRHKRFIEIPDWDRLREMSGFNALYLHLDQVAA